MKKLFYCLLTISTFFVSSYSQWTSNYWGTTTGDNPITESKGLAVAVDNAGYCYVTGYTYNSETGNDIIVIKYGLTGDTLWSRIYNGSANSDDKGYGISVDGSGNIYVTGTASITGKSYEVVLLKYNSDGVLQWASTYGATTSYLEDKGNAITLDASGNIYVTGYCTNSDGFNDLLTMKYDVNGNKEWDRKENGNDDLDAQGYGIAVDNTGNINVTGYCSSNIGSKDILVTQYSTSGVQQWRQIFNGSFSYDDRAYGIAVDSANNIYVTGYTTIDSSAGNTDYITLKYNSSGTLQWNRTYNGSENNSEDRAYGIVVDASDNVYITGYATNSSSLKDYVTIKYNTSGTQQWLRTYNGTGNGNDKANAIAIINNETTVIVTGSSWGPNNNDDYATIKYSVTDGSQIQVSRYSMTGTSEDIAKDVATNDSGTKAAVTGYSQLITENSNGDPTAISTLMIAGGESSELNTTNNIPSQFKLNQNYPNPFNPSTKITFQIGKSSNVKLVVYDMLGREVNTLINQQLQAGSYDITFTTNQLSSGVYFYKLSAGGFTDIKKMTFVK